MDMDFDSSAGFPGETPAPDFADFGAAPVASPIDERLLVNEGVALQALAQDLRRDLDSAIASKNQLNARIERYRAYYALDRDPPAYEGAPNHRTPYIRSKVMGASAHMRGALDQDPFFVARPYTKEGAQSKGPLETMFERELDRSQTRRQLWRGIDEAALTGTGVMQLSVTKPHDEFIIQGRLVRNEDFFVTPVGSEDVARVSTFLRYWEPYHVMRARVAGGEYDEAAIESIRTQITSKPTNYDEKRDGTGVQDGTPGENTVYELYECYYRWADPDNGIEPGLWRIIYAYDVGSTATVGGQSTAGIIAAIPSPYAEAFDAPPYVPLRVRPRPGYFFGEGYAQVLEGIQHVMDWSYNSLIAYDQFAMTPITFVDHDSELFAILKDTGLEPGAIVPTRGAPRESVYSLTPPPPREPYQLLVALRSLGEDATFSDLQLNGMPTTTVRSATEISAIQSASTKMLAADLGNLADDLSTFARMYWALVYHFKIRPKGVMPVFQGSDQYLIASREIDEEELTGHLTAYMASIGQAPPDPMGQAMMRAQLQQQGINFFVASARRDDIEWLPNGAKLVADRLMHANKMERLIGGLLPALSIARQDRAAWHIMKEYLIALDLHNWEDFLPPEPPETFMGPEQMAQFAQMMQQTKQGGGSGS